MSHRRIASLVVVCAVVGMACRASDRAVSVASHAGPPTAVDTMVMLIDSQTTASDPWVYQQAIVCELGRSMREVGRDAAFAAEGAAFDRRSASQNARIDRAVGGRVVFLDDKKCDPYLAARWGDANK
jgi:hypothetical protein